MTGDTKAKVVLAGIIAVVVIVLISIFTSMYQVEADEVGIILRFGKFVRDAEPGLHGKIPLGIETVTMVSVQRVFKEEFGFKTEGRKGKEAQYGPGNIESLMLTGDLNVADVTWIVQYRVKDPYNYLFKVEDPIETMHAMSEAVMRRVVGDRTVTEVLTVAREEINFQSKEELQLLMDDFEAGIEIVTIKLQDVNPPDAVKPAFNEVNEAKQEQERMVNEAWGEYNQEIPQAHGEAERTVAKAEGYALDRVNRAVGDAERFKALYSEYRSAKQVTRQRLYFETIQRVFPHLKAIYIVDEDQKTVVPFLQFAGATGGGGR